MAWRAGETVVIRSVYTGRVRPTGWENWRPDPVWPLRSLPEGWDVV